MGQYPQEYVDYLVYFHAERDFFECHEVLEEYWKSGQMSEYNSLWVGLIQVAVAMYHHRRGRVTGAVKMLSSALNQLRSDDLHALGVDAEQFLLILQDRLQQLQNNPQAPYSDINIPFKDESLLQLCMNQCGTKKLEWGSSSDLLDEHIIHKHTLRDRTEVIELRRIELKKRELLRQSKMNSN